MEQFGTTRQRAGITYGQVIKNQLAQRHEIDFDAVFELRDHVSSFQSGQVATDISGKQVSAHNAPSNSRVSSLCNLCVLCVSVVHCWRHRGHRGCTEKSSN